MSETVELKRWVEDPVRWYAASSFDSEAWGCPGASRQETLDLVRTRYSTRDADERGVVAWIVSAALARPSFVPSPEALSALLEDYEERNNDIWFEDGAGCDPDDPNEIAGLAELIGRVLEHCLDAPESRMLSDFLTLEAVVCCEGNLVIDPEIVP